MSALPADVVPQVLSPVETVDTGSVHPAPEDGIALCLSGGGYRAMLFHLGALWRLNELGYLPRIDRISSVSGGSMTAAVLGMCWSRLQFDAGGVAANFGAQVVTPVRALAGRTVDVPALIGGALLSGSVADHAIAAYRRYLFGQSTLQDLPDVPRFVINATNVQSGVLWRFMKPYMRDYRVGEVASPRVELAVAVGASAAFPPVLSPVKMEVDEDAYTPGSGKDLQYPPYTTDVVLTDGGVYDNLGLETAWKRYKTILVSDAGGRTMPEPEPARDWVRHTARSVALIDGQVRALRKRQVIGSFVSGERTGAYWGIRTDIANYGLPNPLPCPLARTTELAQLATRLKRLENVWQERLINWGYAVCDAAMRRHANPSLPAPAGFPYEIGV